MRLMSPHDHPYSASTGYDSYFSWSNLPQRISWCDITCLERKRIRTNVRHRFTNNHLSFYELHYPRRESVAQSRKLAHPQPHHYYEVTDALNYHYEFSSTLKTISPAHTAVRRDTPLKWNKRPINSFVSSMTSSI